MLKALMGKKIICKMDYVKRGGNKKTMLKIKSAVKAEKNAFHGLNRRLHAAKERSCELEYRSKNISQIKMQRGKRMEKTDHPRTV